jgi:hypothetical protein
MIPWAELTIGVAALVVLWRVIDKGLKHIREVHDEHRTERNENRQMHRDERDEWQKHADQRAYKSDVILEKLNEVIKDIAKTSVK